MSDTADARRRRLVATAAGALLALTCAAAPSAMAVDTPYPDTIAGSVTAGTDLADLALSPNGERAYLAHRDTDSVSVVDTASLAVLATVAVGDRPAGLAVTPDGGRVYVTNAGSDDVSVIDTTTNTVTTTVAVGDSPQRVVVSPDGRYVYVGDLAPNAGPSTLSVIDTGTNTRTRFFLGLGAAWSMGISPDGEHLYVGTISPVAVHEIATAGLHSAEGWGDVARRQINAPGYPHSIAVSPDGARVYVADGIQKVFVIDVAAGEVVASVLIQSDPRDLVVSPDGSRVYVSHSVEGAMTVIDAATNKAIHTVSGATPPFGHLALSPDGNRLYVGRGWAPGDVAVLSPASTVTIRPSAPGYSDYQEVRFLGDTLTPLNEPVWPGYAFRGWSASPDGSTGLLTFPRTITTGPTDLWGQWEKEPPLAGPAPTVTGRMALGETLTASAGAWTTGATLAYQWQRNGLAISGATHRSYRLSAADVGATITVRITASKDGFDDVSRTSEETQRIEPGVLRAQTPRIAGATRVGSTLTAAPGAWTAGTRLTYRWARDGRPIPGATSRTYTLTPSDLRRKIAVTVTGTNTGYTATSKTSLPSSAIVPGILRAVTPRVAGPAKIGRTLKVQRGSWTPGTRFTYQWLRNGRPIPGATKSTYRVKRADARKRISVRVTGSKVGYTQARKVSPRTRAVPRPPRR